MTDFLLELRSEEIPARMQAKAREDLARLFAAELAKAGLAASEIVTYATPRRLALIARDLPAETAAVSEEVKGPRASAPPQALEGFLRKTGLTREQLVDRDGVFFAVIERPGRATADVLAEAIPAIVRAFPWPKSMRWGDASLSTESPRWVRPLQGIVALLGDDIVRCEVAGVTSGAATVGHRFHHPGIITIGSASDYAEKLRACHVIVDQDERASIIALGATMLTAKAGLTLIRDEGLLAENAGLTEWPVPLLGRFDPEFLSVPPEVIQLTARLNQKYFVCNDGEGRLANAFVCVANLDAKDGGAKIVEGNRKVLAARLSDARFFYETDLKTRLEDQAAKLDRYVEKLGTFRDKTGRMMVTAEWLCDVLGGRERAEVDQLRGLASRSTFLFLADQPTLMVGEFPELEGVIGSYYAADQGEDPRVVEALRSQYKPKGPTDDVPNSLLATIHSLSYKIESRVAFFVGGIHATGSKDPFGIRRTELGIIRLILENRLRMSLGALLSVPFANSAYHDRVDVDSVLSSIADRLKVQQREAGVRHDLIDAVFALGGEDDLVRLLARVHALQAFVATPDGANLLAGYKRAANILKKEGVTRAEWKTLSYTPEPAESELVVALDSAEPKARAAIEAEAFGEAMVALATLRAPIDAFFDAVTVNDPDADKRAARLALLVRMRDAVHAVADFSKIEG